MAIVKLFTYEWPSYMCNADVCLDSETGQAYDLLYVMGPGIAGTCTVLDRETPISYDEVRRKAQIAYDDGLARHAAFLIDPSAYDALSEDSWREFVQNPPKQMMNPSVGA